MAYEAMGGDRLGCHEVVRRWEEMRTGSRLLGEEPRSGNNIKAGLSDSAWSTRGTFPGLDQAAQRTRGQLPRGSG